jgi:hypothetical protein
MKEKCGCCNYNGYLKVYSNISNIRNCMGTTCKNSNYCNTCYNCNCHSFPGHFMSVNRLKCKNSCITLNYSFDILKFKCYK